MTTNSDTSQLLESYIPVYDAVPEKWEEARAFVVEQLKKLSEGTNVREIGWLLEEKLLTGKQFIPVQTDPLVYREVFRKVVTFSGGLAAGANSVAHGITFDVNFTLIDLWVSATNSITFNAVTLSDDNVTMDATNINVTSPGVFDRAYAFIEFCQEI